MCICFLVSVCAGLGMGQVHAENTKEEPEELYARSAVLMDADSGRILFEKDAENQMPMASTTKIMTCILALEHLEEGQTVTASEEAIHQPKVHLGMKKEEVFYVRDLLYSLMLESHNDSAVLIAEAIGGSVKEFADMMNEKAREIGCENTYFITPNGLDAEDDRGTHSTTAKELARIMKYCIHDSAKKEEFLEITRTQEYSFTDVSGKRRFSCYNHNAFLQMMDGALSGKTGFTADAGYCYVGALRQDGKTFIVALLACGWPNNKTYKWADTKKLMTYGLENYEQKEVLEAIETERIIVTDAVNRKNPYQSENEVETKVQKISLSLLMKKEEEIEVKIEQTKKLQAPVAANTKVGTVTYLLNGECLGTTDILTTKAVAKRTVSWCLAFLKEKILL